MVDQPWWLSLLECQFSHSVDCCVASGGSNPARGYNIDRPKIGNNFLAIQIAGRWVETLTIFYNCNTNIVEIHQKY